MFNHKPFNAPIVARALISTAVALISIGIAHTALSPTPAQAWVQTTTCGESIECTIDETPHPTHWETPCVAFHLNKDGTSDIPDLDAVVKIVLDAIQAWNIPKKSSLTAHYSGLTDEDRIGFNPYTKRNANIIVFRDANWRESRAIMALTTVTQHKNTGEIFDADIEINSQYYPYGIVATDGPQVVDLQNTLTHELGHAFGIAHSDVASATMFPYSGTGDTSLSSLDADDIAAIATIYPPSKLSCKFTDDFFEAPPFAMDARPPSSDACTAAPSTAATRAPSVLLFAALTALAFAFTRRRFGRQPK